MGGGPHEKCAIVLEMHCIFETYNVNFRFLKSGGFVMEIFWHTCKYTLPNSGGFAYDIALRMF